jgi:hypothetical protein
MASRPKQTPYNVRRTLLEQLVIDGLRSFGPYAVALWALFWYREEIKRALFAPRQDGQVEKLLTTMNEQFALNLVYFKGLDEKVGRMIQILDQIKDETIRNNRRS